MIEAKFIRKQPWSRSLILRSIGRNGRKYYTIKIEEHEDPGERTIKPSTDFEDDSVESHIFKEIIKAGLDSDLSNDSSMSSELRATKDHLEDMKKIVFHQLKMTHG